VRGKSRDDIKFDLEMCGHICILLRTAQAESVQQHLAVFTNFNGKI